MPTTTHPATPLSKLPPITKRQTEILLLLYKFRFLTRPQIQQLLGHKTKDGINRWLKDLSEKNYIETTYTKRLEGTPSLVRTGPLAIQYFKTQDNLVPGHIARLSRDRERTRDVIEACLLVADCAIEIARRNTPGTQYAFANLSGYCHPDSKAHFFSGHKLSPDAIIIQQTGQEDATSCVLEVLPKFVPLRSIFSLIKNYIELYESDEWEDNLGLDFPRVVIAFKYSSQLYVAKRYEEDEQEEYEDGPVFEFVLLKQLKAEGIVKYLQPQQDNNS